MDVDIRPITNDQFEEFLKTVEAAFGEVPEPEHAEKFAKFSDPQRMFAARDGSTMVGTAGAYAFDLTVPGGSVKAGGVTVVGVLPSHRRRGVLTKMMRAQIDDEHERREPIAVLWASEDPIYQRFGYGAAAVQAHIDLPRAEAAFLTPEPQVGQAHMITADEALNIYPVVYDQVKEQRPGMYARWPEWWRFHRLRDPESDREGFSPRWHVVWEDPSGEVGAYAMYRVKTGWEQGFAVGTLQVDEAMGVDAVATREIWRYLFGVDLITNIAAYHLPSDHALRYLLLNPRSLRFMSGEALWLRIIDLPEALEARAYKHDGSLVVDIVDDFCPWNAGTWSIDVHDGKAKVTRAAGEAALSMTVNELACTYLGETTFAQLASAGRVRELSPGAVASATQMFRWDIAPWCPEVF
ncbi:MAG: GNAT family N-acetyltransferase [Actinomycetota bacterium]|nr:GNAT family N-acetyltransferase [Actinomycetota bacterium]